jgi:hypothetical protein
MGGKFSPLAASLNPVHRSQIISAPLSYSGFAGTIFYLSSSGFVPFLQRMPREYFNQAGSFRILCNSLLINNLSFYAL